MTTKELIAWADKAQEAREKSWMAEKRYYKLTLRQASEITRPDNALPAEIDMVTCLNSQCWNEVQVWNEEL